MKQIRLSIQMLALVLIAIFISTGCTDSTADPTEIQATPSDSSFEQWMPTPEGAVPVTFTLTPSTTTPTLGETIHVEVSASYPQSDLSDVEFKIVLYAGLSLVGGEDQVIVETLPAGDVLNLSADIHVDRSGEGHIVLELVSQLADTITGESSLLYDKVTYYVYVPAEGTGRIATTSILNEWQPDQLPSGPGTVRTPFGPDYPYTPYPPYLQTTPTPAQLP